MSAAKEEVATPRCEMCSRWQALAEAAQLGQCVAERRRGVLEEYVKKMDGIIEDVGGVTASCINPYEDLKRALQGQKARAETAEAALLAKSAEYDALVARIEAAPLADIADDGKHNGTSSLLSAAIAAGYYKGQRVRLLVSDDRPSHTAGENREGS